MKLEGCLSKKSKLAVARGRYGDYRQRKKESKTYMAILFAMAEGVCPRCGVKMIMSFDNIYNNMSYAATLDHVYPLSKELEHNKFGLEIMCKSCNSKKGSQ